jgi:hypothetical protein
MLALPHGNFPGPAEIYKWTKAWDGRNIDFCEICEGVCAGYDCGVCPIKYIKDEQEAGEKPGIIGGARECGRLNGGISDGTIDSKN